MLRTLPRSLAKSTRQFASVSVEKQPIEVLQTAFNVRLPPQAPLPELSTTKLGNGVQVAALETKLPTASLTFAVNASSRFENADNLGVSHFLRLFGYKGVQGRTAFRLAREFDIHGANLHISANREQIFYTAEFLRDELSLVADLVSGIFTSPQFSLHEVEEVRERVQLDLDHLDNNSRLLQLVHKAAFRNGLGNSLYAPEISVGEIEQGTLEAFSKKHFVGGNIAVVGSGVDLHDLEGLLGHIGHLPAGKADASAAKYFGSEVVVGRFDSTSRAAVAYPTTGADYYKAAIVHHILGGQSRVQYGKGQSLLAKVAGSKASIASFSATYSDVGLLGFTVSAPQGSGIQGLVEQATSQLKSLSSSVSEADLTRGKNLAKVEYASSLESRTSVAEGLSSQLLSSGQTYSTAAFNAGIDKVTPADIQGFVAKLLQSKATLVAAADDF